MSTSRVLFAGFALNACAVAAYAAAPITLNLRPGLWEMTSSAQTSGMPPIPQEMLDRMPPDRRAKLEASIAARQAAGAKPHMRKTCVTPKSLQRGLKFDERAESGCEQTVTSSTGKTMDVQIACRGARQRTTGTMHFIAAGPESVRGTIDMTIGDGTHNMNVKSVIEGKWLAADCGDVKPSE